MFYLVFQGNFRREKKKISSVNRAKYILSILGRMNKFNVYKFFDVNNVFQIIAQTICVLHLSLFSILARQIVMTLFNTRGRTNYIIQHKA